MEIIPGILATDETEYAEVVEKLNKLAALEGGWVQLDLMDEKFVKNRSVGMEVIKKYLLNFHIEAQLMVEYPENWIDDLIEMKVERIVFPVEDESGIDERITHLRNHGVSVGLSINPDTELRVLTEWLDQIDEVLIMSVQPGFGGQEFIEKSVARVKELRNQSNNVRIEVDGGVTPEIIGQLITAGADMVVIGAERMINKGIDEYLEEIWQITTS